MNSIEDLVAQVIQDLGDRFANPIQVIDPDCESPIEFELLHMLEKVISPDVRIRRQQVVDVGFTEYRLDFILERPANGRAIGLECDGKDFHDPVKDSFRDRQIIKTGRVSKIYRLRGRDINFRLADTLDLLGKLEPWVFSERGRTNLDVLAHREHLRDDLWGASQSGYFPFAAVRRYAEYGEWDNTFPDEWLDEMPWQSMRPTVIYWTGAVEGGELMATG